jgi:hypothetical protein
LAFRARIRHSQLEKCSSPHTVFPPRQADKKRKKRDTDLGNADMRLVLAALVATVSTQKVSLEWYGAAW